MVNYQHPGNTTTKKSDKICHLIEKYLATVLVLAGKEVNFFTVAFMGLCFGFETRTVLITQSTDQFVGCLIHLESIALGVITEPHQLPLQHGRADSRKKLWLSVKPCSARTKLSLHYQLCIQNKYKTQPHTSHYEKN